MPATVASGARNTGEWGPTGSVEESVPENKPQRGDAIFPADRFAFRIIAARVADRRLVEPIPATRQFGRQLRLDAEPVGLQLEDFDAFAFENFVAGFHVAEVEIADHVGEQREKF